MQLCENNEIGNLTSNIMYFFKVKKLEKIFRIITN